MWKRLLTTLDPAALIIAIDVAIKVWNALFGDPEDR